MFDVFELDDLLADVIELGERLLDLIILEVLFHEVELIRITIIFRITAPYLDLIISAIDFFTLFKIIFTSVFEHRPEICIEIIVWVEIGQY